MLSASEGNAMSEPPPVQPPDQPSNQPTQPLSAPFGTPYGATSGGAPPGPPAGSPPGSPAGTPANPVGPPLDTPFGPLAGSPVGPPPGTASGPAAAAASVDATKANAWQRATATTGRRWALAVTAGALALLLFVGAGVASFVVLRNHDRFSLLGNRAPDGRFLRHPGPGNERFFGGGQGPGGNGANPPGQPNLPGRSRGGGQGLGGLGNIGGGTALHGNLTTTADGSVVGLVFQRGQATSVSAGSITIKSSDGFVGTYGRSAATRSRGTAIVKGGQAFVLARATDKVAIIAIAATARAAAPPAT
jgi:hypothetical protein